MNKEQRGGSGRVIPKFNGDMNNPAKTREEKAGAKVHSKDKFMMEERKKKIFPPPDPPQPIVDLKIMDGILGDKQPPPPPNPIYPMMQVPIPNPNNPIAGDYLIPTQYNPQQVPIIKKYNISINGLNDVVSASQIFEDILPESKLPVNRMTTLGERLVLHSYIRSILLKRGDGEEVSFDDKKHELINLLSYMKMMEINPYHFSRLTSNTYKGMSDNFLMLRSCYPIRMDKKFNGLSCATDNIGANIRIYALSVYDELANVINEGSIRKVFSDVWRELMFYTYLREEILKKKLCPHFPYLHTYYFAENTTVDFDSLKKINGKATNNDFAKKKTKQKLFTNHLADAITTTDGYNYTINMDAFQKIRSKKVISYSKNVKGRAHMKGNGKLDVNGDEVSVNERSNKCLVAITEAPDQNIIDWSTRTYVIEDGPIRKQITNGTHSELTWKSLLFQLLTTFVTMYKHDLIIREFKWGKNLFIKTFDDTGAIGYWRYKVRGIDFYVPNMKAMLMVDSCFDQITDGYTDELKNNMKFKLHGDFMNTPTTITSTTGFNINLEDIAANKRDLMIEMFEAFFNSNEMTSEFPLYGGIKPPASIISLIDRIKGYNFLDKDGTGTATDLADIFVLEFGEFLHNKVGTLVDQTDEQQLYDYGVRTDTCSKGQLVAYTPDDENRGVLFWAIVIGSTDDTGGSVNLLVFDKTTNNYKQEPDVPTANCRTIFGDIQQKYKPDHKINSTDELLETYNINI